MLTVAVPAQAQDLRVDVTGSNIRRVDNEQASPIQVITREDIERTGAVSLSEVMAFLPSSGFSIDDRVTNGFTGGAGGLNLRNLGFNSTLLLLNGRRMPTYPFAQRLTTGSQGFQDLNSIPVGAIERIEILKDGASAIYGADAVGGVVNIILRNSYKGLEAGASYGETQEGDGETFTANASLGFGDLEKDRYNVFVNFAYLKRDATFTKGRNFANTEDLRSRGGLDLRSGFGYPGTFVDAETGDVVYYPDCTTQRANRCRYDRAAFGGVLPEVERFNVLARGEFALNKDVSIFAEGMYGRNETYNIGFPSPSSDDPGIGSNILPIGHPQNPFPNEAVVFHRYADVGNRDNDGKSDMYRGVLGAKGTFRNWDWETYGSWNKIEIDEKQLNNVPATTALETILDRSYNFTNPFANDPSVTNKLRYNGLRTGESTFDDYGIKASGEIWKLPAGPMMAAFGAQHTSLEAEDIPDENIASGNLLGISGSAANGKQNLFAVFGEIIVPVVKGLEISGALRYDDYSKSGDFSRTSPKVGVRWQPNRNFLMRGTYSEAFRAPSIFDTTSASQSSFEFSLVDPTRCITGNEPDCNLDVRVNTTGNPNLQAEKSKIWNFGVVFDPVPNASFSVDVYNIKRRDEITLFSTQTLINLFANDPNIVIRDATGEIDQVNNVPVQLAETETTGIDFEARWRIPLNSWGTLQLQGAGAYVIDYDYTTLGDSGALEKFNFNGTYNQPRFRASWDMAWLYGAHTFSLNGYYIHSYDALNPTATHTEIGAVDIWNFFWKWQATKALTVNVSVANLMDRKPPFSNETSASNAGYNPSQSDPRGRYFQAGLQYKFW